VDLLQDAPDVTVCAAACRQLSDR